VQAKPDGSAGIRPRSSTDLAPIFLFRFREKNVACGIMACDPHPGACSGGCRNPKQRNYRLGMFRARASLGLALSSPSSIPGGACV
jgi:hypothetical protein